MSNTATFPFVLQDSFISVLLNGRVYPVSKGQPTFRLLHQAISRKQWNKVPKLITLAGQLAEKSHGKVTVTSEGVFYRGQKIDNTLTMKIQELIEHGKPVAHLLKFMDNLYKQKDMNTVNEIYQWLASGRFALTDDGCFLAYKKVDDNYKDCHTHTIDNHVGQVVTMPRKEVDPNRHNECSRGLHFCSRGYLTAFMGSHIMEVKVNPADVVAIPVDYGYTKGRTWRYEVMREVQPGEMVEGQTDSPVMMQPVIEFAKDRAELIKQVMALPTVKRLIRENKLSAASFSKASVDRLKGWLQKFARMDIAPVKSKLFDNPLRFSREAAGLTKGQVAKQVGMTLAQVYNAERSMNPSQELIDKLLTAIATLQGNVNVSQAGVSYPRPASKVTYAPQPVYSPTQIATADEDDDDDDDDDDEEGEEEYDDGYGESWDTDDED